ncbi:MAG: phospho-N-acetylmuramoyl-pentapeptide-transferase [Tissierellia bacterium]|nr:phospho-N-acetylmuramoyl-pentapeptide-transferase [Tissierellia bacterium]
MDYVNILVIIISIVLAYLAVPILLKVLTKGNVLESNYKGENIPICMGLLFVFVQVFNLSILYLFFVDDINYIIYLFSLILIGFVGLMDDLMGEKDVKGLKGHILNFLKGNPTTGGIKAGVGFLVSLFVSMTLSSNIIDIIINTMVIALFTNLINLFDLRPGRSSKVFILFSIIMLISSTARVYGNILYSFLGLLLIYLPLDLKAKVMMGDVGSNTMGFTLGIYCAYSQSLMAQMIYLLFLIILHVLAEKVSFTKIIEKNKVLRLLDNLGR